MEILHRTFGEKSTRESYSRVAWFYDFWGRLTESRAANKVLELAGIKNGSRILEIAVGTGSLFMNVVKRNPDGENTGIDLSADMLRKARKKLGSLPSGNYTLREGNVFNLDVGSDTVDVLLNNFMVDLMPEQDFERIAATFYRVLKPGGIAVVSTMSFGTRPVHKMWFGIARRMPGLMTGCRPVSFRPYLEKAGFRIEEQAQLSQNTFPSEVIKARKPG